jgi:hypothetical protein
MPHTIFNVMPEKSEGQRKRKGTKMRLAPFLFEKRQSSMRVFAVLPALVGLLFIGHACQDAGILGATPYVGIIILSLTYVVRPMIALWAPVFGVFVVYFLVVALHPQNGPVGEWIIFMLFGFVPALLLWFARPRRPDGTQPITALDRVGGRGYGRIMWRGK